MPSRSIIQTRWSPSTRKFVAFMSSLAQYTRDLTVSEVIKGSQQINDRPFGNIASIQRLGTDLRYALDRSSYGNILALTHEVGQYLRTALDLFEAPDIMKNSACSASASSDRPDEQLTIRSRSKNQGSAILSIPL